MTYIVLMIPPHTMITGNMTVNTPANLGCRTKATRKRHGNWNQPTSAVVEEKTSLSFGNLRTYPVTNVAI